MRLQGTFRMPSLAAFSMPVNILSYWMSPEVLWKRQIKECCRVWPRWFHWEIPYLLNISTPVSAACPACAYSIAASGYSQEARYRHDSWRPEPCAAKKPIIMDASPKSIIGRPTGNNNHIVVIRKVKVINGCLFCFFGDKRPYLDRICYSYLQGGASRENYQQKKKFAAFDGLW